MRAEVGSHNGHTIYIRMPTGEVDRFVGIALSDAAARMVAAGLNALLERWERDWNPGRDRTWDWVEHLPAVPKRERDSG